MTILRKVLTGTLVALLASTSRADDLGLKVAPGFRVTVYADENLANDIYAMTLDAQGRVVVTSQGWIKTLHDTKGAGKADKVTDFARTNTGGMGMCFDGNDLYFCGDGWFSRYRDSRGRGQADDGPPERFIPMQFGEHGGHAMRKGPDGYWYIIGGNDCGISKKHATAPHSLIRDPEAGGMLRLTPDLKQCEIIAQGFRNPYDFDFNEAGDLFTYDSDVESDFFLPWYSPTRLYHVGVGGHHGWRLSGWRRSWCRPDYYADTVDILWPVGRGSPTGVTCYRHDQFPERYRGGLFVLDWTFGKVFFFPLEANGASYRTKPEVFIEPIGTHGFAPTDVAVAPDGSLFLSIGGRRTRGTVYKIEYVGDEKPKRRPEPKTDLDAVLYAPQPLDAWSRARWQPLARKLGAAPLAAVVADEKLDVSARVRAVEGLTEMFGGVPIDTARVAARSTSPLVRARLAWSLGRAPRQGCEDPLLALTEDADPRVRLFALTALSERLDLVATERVMTILRSNFGHADKRVRQAAARLAALRGRVPVDMPSMSEQTRLTLALNNLWLGSHTASDHAIVAALGVLTRPEVPTRPKDTDLQLQALRLLMMAWGDFHLQDPSVEAYTAYELRSPPQARDTLARSALGAVRPLFPSKDERLDHELSRVLAMLEDSDPDTVRKVAAHWSKNSSPTWDMHYLVVMSRLKGKRGDDLAARTADTILSLDRKLRGDQQRNKQNWGLRLAEVTANLVKYDPPLADALLKHADFVRPGHVALVSALDADRKKQAARRFLDAVKKDDDFAWSGELIDLLATLPAGNARPVFRTQWPNFGLRESLLMRLVDQPEEADRDKFLFGLESGQQQIVHASLTALERLPRDANPKNLAPVLRLLRRLTLEPKEAKLRAEVFALLVRQAGQPFAVKEDKTDPVALKNLYQPVFDWFLKEHPAFAGSLNGSDDENPEVWSKLLHAVDWSKGNVARGEALYRVRACVTCHSGPSRLGPDLNGVTGRFSHADLFVTVIYPSRDVAPPYRVTDIETRSGQVYSGIVAFESADGVILQTGATTTVRVATTDIVSRRAGTKSLMPNGLLKDLKPQEIADLYAFLQTLKQR